MRSLTAFFNEYKDVEPKPGSPDPAFKIPTRAAFDYFEVHYEHFFDPTSVSEANIKAGYRSPRSLRYQYHGTEEFDLDEPEKQAGRGPPTSPRASRPRE